MNNYRVTVTDLDGFTDTVWVDALNVYHACMLVAAQEDWSPNFIEHLVDVTAVLETN